MKSYLTSATERVRAAGERVLLSERRGPLSYLPFLGPAIIASIAYMDPGNFATNIGAGAAFGYRLLWVVLLANLIAMLFQSLSAKLGIVTGKSLAELCRQELPRGLVRFLWIVSEGAAIATDLAEVLGAALGLTLLIGTPLMFSCVVVGVTTYGVLSLQNYGFRPMEIVIGAFVSIISLSYVAELFIARPIWSGVFSGIVLPQVPVGGVTLAVGIVGATVMPHAIYLHSSLTKDRMPVRGSADKRQVLRFSNHEVLLALGLAGLVNLAMVIVSAAVFYMTGHAGGGSLENAYVTLAPLFGIAAAGIFMLSLLASGFSSSVVGTMAGASIMQDFAQFQIPLWVRRAVTLLPALAIVGLGRSVTTSLIWSQVILSLVLPAPMLALLWFTSRSAVMGEFVNSRIMTVVAGSAAFIVLALNLVLLLQLLHG